MVTKAMYAGKHDNKQGTEELDSSSEMVETLEASPEVTVEEKMANNEAIWQKAEAKLEEEDTEEDDVPPPLPAKDYETGKMDTLAEKLQALVDASAREEANKAAGHDSEDNDVSDNVPVVAREYNRSISDEYNQNTSIVNSNLIHDRDCIIEEEAIGQTNYLDEDEHEPSDKEDKKKFYAPDSSDEDEDEDDDDFASREVNFDDSETEDEDFDKYISNTNQDSTPEALNISDTEDLVVKEVKEVNKDDQSAESKNVAERQQNGSPTGDLILI